MNNIKFKCFELKEFLCSSIFSKIKLITKKDVIFKNKNGLCLINLIPFFINKSILKFLGFSFLYENDDLTYYSNEINSGLGPLLIEILVDDINIKHIFDNYFNNVPINLIFLDSNYLVEDDSIIKIKIKKIGIEYEKEYIYSDIKSINKFELLSENIYSSIKNPILIE